MSFPPASPGAPGDPGDRWPPPAATERRPGDAPASAGIDPVAQLLPALSAGARALRDPTAYLAALLVLALTLLPAALLWYLAASRTAALFMADPFGPGGPGLERLIGGAGLLLFVTLLVGLVAFLGYLWTWMTLAVRAASLERGAPLAVWASVTVGLRRTVIAFGGWLVVLVLAIPVLVLYVLAQVMADVVVLSGVSVLLTIVVVVAVFAWWLGLLVITAMVGAIAAADRSATLPVVLRRAVGLTLRHPAAVILVLIGAAVVASVLVTVLYVPTAFAGMAGFSVVGAMADGGRTVSAAVLGAVVAALLGIVLLLVPLSFTASALAGFAVRVEPEFARIDATRRTTR